MDSDVVYFDDSLATSWIAKDTWSTKIRDYLVSKGFVAKDAVGLVKWAKETLVSGAAGTSRLVFSQDLVPASFMQSSPNGLLRRYLDAGGRVVWVGDTPLWTQALSSGGGGGKDREEVWQSGLTYGLLQVHMLIADSSSRTQWSPSAGHHFKSHWLSLRPINLEVNGDWSPRKLGDLTVTPLASSDVTLLPSAWNALVIGRWKKSGKHVKGLGLSLGTIAGGLGGNVQISEEIPKELSLKPLNLASAWHVSYHARHPMQGFYRFWDRGSEEDEPPPAFLEDLLKLANLA